MKLWLAFLGGLLLTISGWSQVPVLRTDPLPGVYLQERTLSVKTLTPAQISYRFLGSRGSFLPYTDPILLSSLPGERRTYKIEFQIESDLGQKDLQVLEWTIDSSQSYQKAVRENPAPGFQEPRPRILSPSSGTFSYRPWLVLLNPSGKPLFYRVRTAGQILLSGLYEGPVELPAGGNLNLEVGPYGGVAETSLLYSADDEPLPDLLPTPGFYRTSLSWPVPSGNQGWKYNFGEKTFLPWTTTLELPIQPGSLSMHSLQVLSPEGILYRIPLLLEGRPVTGPRTSIRAGIPPELEILSPPEGVTWLQSGEKPPLPWTGSITLTKESPPLEVFTKYQDGRISPTTVLAPSLWKGYFEPPEVQIHPRGVNLKPLAGMKAVYTLGREGENPPAPNENSPLLSGNSLLPLVPVGMEWSVGIRFAWIDGQGRVGPASGVHQLRVDKESPPSPVIGLSDQFLTLQGDGSKIWYRLVADSSSLRNPGFSEYTGPVALPQEGEGKLVRYTLTTFASDDVGNESPLVQRRFVSDRRAPGIQGFLNLGANQTLNDEKVILQPEILGDFSEVRYTFSLDGTQPPDPAAQGTLYKDPLELTFPEGQETKVMTLWNLKTPEGWLYPQAKEFNFVVDRELPSPPRFESPWQDTLVETESWTVRAQGASLSDRLYYTWSSGSAPMTPTGSTGKPWTGSLTLNRSEGRDQRLKLVVIDPAGNTLALPEIRFYFQTRTPTAPLLKDNRGAVRTPYILEFTPTGGTIRFEVTNDGSLPALPGDDSPAYTGPVLLEAPGAKPVLYRVRAMRITEGGLARSFSPVQEVLVQPQSTPSGSAVGGTGPTVLGLPENGVSNKELTLKLSGAGEWKYELTSGFQDPVALTAFSLSFPPQLTISVPEGQEKSFVLTVGTPGGGQSTYRFRIDRKLPTAPDLSFRRTAEGVRGQVSAPGENTLVWRWEYWDGPTGTTKRGLGTSVLDLPLPQKTYGSFRWSGYYQDPAGNQSPPTVGSLVWAHGTLFVAPGIDQGGDGSPENPMTDLRRLEGINSGNTRVVLLGGDYTITSPLVLTNLSLSGGWDPDTMTVDPQVQKTVIRIQRNGQIQLRGESQWSDILIVNRSQAPSALDFQRTRLDWKTIEIESDSDGEIMNFASSVGRFQKVNIQSQGSTTLQLLRFRDTDLEWQASEVLQSGGSASVAIVLKDSFLNIKNARIAVENSDTGWLIRSENSTIDSTSARFEVLGTQEFARVAVLENSLWKDRDSEVTVKSRGYLTVIRSQESSLDWEKTTMRLEPGTSRVVGLELRGQNAVRMVDGLWASPRGTLIDGIRSRTWSWERMKTEGWGP